MTAPASDGVADRYAAAAALERAWRDGWSECKACLTDDEAHCLTDDVEDDAWLDSVTAAAIRAGEPS